MARLNRPAAPYCIPLKTGEEKKNFKKNQQGYRKHERNGNYIQHLPVLQPNRTLPSNKILIYRTSQNTEKKIKSKSTFIWPSLTHRSLILDSEGLTTLFLLIH